MFLTSLTSLTSRLESGILSYKTNGFNFSNFFNFFNFIKKKYYVESI